MDRKHYQKATLATLAQFAGRALAVGPHQAFAKQVKGEYYYRDQGLGQTPYVCLRMPTGAGKTLVAADAIPVIRGFLNQDYPLTLWLVPSTTILDQTVAALGNPQHPYREGLNVQFGIDRVRVLRLDEATSILPQEVGAKALIVVTTTQALRIDKEKQDARKIYAPHEDLDSTFERLPSLATMDRGPDGKVLASFVNLCRAWPPLVIVDEAHNVRTSLSFDTLLRFSPAFILELTATPATDAKTGSNVLARVTARELRDSNMIKLPVVVTEYGGDWRATVAGAVRERAALEELARQDGRGIRPITLYQAERKDDRRDEVVSPEVIRAHLIAVEGIAEAEIAIATGTRRDIDGVDLFRADCPIRHIITVQALKEGWDCAWAYVLCSVANIRSAKDIEQLLGRVLRMPNALASHFDPLNRAYAHVTHGCFQSTAAQLRDALITLGFDRTQANEAIQSPLLPLDDDDLLATRRGTTVALAGPPPTLMVCPATAWRASPSFSKATTGIRLSIDPATAPAAIERLCERLPANHRQPICDAYQEALDRRCPAERGASLTLPLLAWRQGDMVYGEATTTELRHHGRFSTRDCARKPVPGVPTPWPCAARSTPTPRVISSCARVSPSPSSKRPFRRAGTATASSICWPAHADGADTTEADLLGVHHRLGEPPGRDPRPHPSCWYTKTACPPA
jgi:type III restriction enzyme